MPLPAKNHVGSRFGRLLVLERIRWGYISPRGVTQTTYRCLCDCGKETTVLGSLLFLGKTTSCGCYHSERTREVMRLRPFEYLYNLLIAAAKRREYPCSLTYEEFAEFTKETSCQYCGAPVIWEMYASRRKEFSYGHHMDRKDNKLGYTKDNCIVCCRRCNWGKGDMFTYEEWKKIGEVIKTFPKSEAA
jgi:5-methylcytosine-specific restriction endonuclease McrA